MTRTLLLFCCFCFCFSASAQQVENDSTAHHSPRKATLLSAVLPGAGQVYNEKYWKLPIIYGGIGVAAYYLNDNLDKVDLYRSSLIALQDGDSTTVNTTRFNETTLTELLDIYKRYRDISYIAIAGIYILQIVDAHVDAQLFYFDVSDDLSMTALPYVGGAVSPEAGVSLTFRF